MRIFYYNYNMAAQFPTILNIIQRYWNTNIISLYSILINLLEDELQFSSKFIKIVTLIRYKSFNFKLFTFSFIVTDTHLSWLDLNFFFNLHTIIIYNE